MDDWLYLSGASLNGAEEINLDQSSKSAQDHMTVFLVPVWVTQYSYILVFVCYKVTCKTYSQPPANLQACLSIRAFSVILRVLLGIGFVGARLVNSSLVAGPCYLTEVL